MKHSAWTRTELRRKSSLDTRWNISAITSGLTMDSKSRIYPPPETAPSFAKISLVVKEAHGTLPTRPAPCPAPDEADVLNSPCTWRMWLLPRLPKLLLQGTEGQLPCVTGFVISACKRCSLLVVAMVREDPGIEVPPKRVEILMFNVSSP
jgi:hypothetical protein